MSRTAPSSYISFLFRLLILIPSVTLGRFAHCLHIYLWTDLAFSRDFHTSPLASIPFSRSSMTFAYLPIASPIHVYKLYFIA